MPRVEFESDTLEELVRMARRWVAGFPEFGADETASQPPVAESLEEVLARIKSPASLQFLREVAGATLAGEALAVDDELRRRCGLPSGRNFVGVQGVANRTMRARAGRDLVSWDPDARGYRMSSTDAEAVVDTLGSTRDGSGRTPQ
jgi:hypothetical protein